MEIHQFLPSLVDHDAIGSHVRHLQQLITDMGIPSEIYAWEWRGERSRARDYRTFDPVPPPRETWMLYHLSTATEVAPFVASRPERLAVNYHNITPAELFAPWEPTIGRIQEDAREQLRDLAPRTELAIGVSAYNEAELRSCGYGATTVAPILFDPEEFHREPDRKVAERLREAKARGGSDWLFVGRVAPHKCQHDVIKAFALYQRLYDPKARLHIVGGIASHLYWNVLHRYLDVLELHDSVTLTGTVGNGALGAYYRNADVFVCLSEHEGFGVPLLEALHNDVPVVAFDAAAVGETVGEGGILLADKSPGMVAAAVHRVVSDEAVSGAMRERGRQRLARFTFAAAAARWREIIGEMVAG